MTKYNYTYEEYSQDTRSYTVESDVKLTQEEMPYGTQKARTGDPDEFIYNALEDLGLPLGEQQL